MRATVKSWLRTGERVDGEMPVAPTKMAASATVFVESASGVTALTDKFKV